jgi:hypothetical protein
VQSLAWAKKRLQELTNERQKLLVLIDQHGWSLGEMDCPYQLLAGPLTDADLTIKVREAT